MAKNKKTTEYAVKYLRESSKMSDAQIAKELNITEEEVSKFPPTKISRSKNLMINETMSKKQKTVSIMTESASQLNDDLTKKLKNSRPNKPITDCIFRPNDK
jgi:hypothetical protein